MNGLAGHLRSMWSILMIDHTGIRGAPNSILTSLQWTRTTSFETASVLQARHWASSLKR